MKKDLLREILLCVFVVGLRCRYDIVFVPCAGQAKEAGKEGAVLCGVLPQKSRLTRCHYSLIFMLCIPSSVEFFT